MENQFLDQDGTLVLKNLEDSRVSSTKYLVRESLNHKCIKFFIQASATGYYGDRQDKKCTEDSSCGEGFLSNICQSWEQETLPIKTSSIRLVVLRIGVVMGKSSNFLQKLKFFIQLNKELYQEVVSSGFHGFT